ncbi:acyl-CoA N-acyltransferase [Pseudovirgaria hyperparasitica]|uniref:Acyl-CoA N-acyltransferase n=1 Tax=Pseudovirgaria hyperparasitica TaxID=470096 RepID=A0A6A6VYT5_9PEZI|nr:acyl-CoA N-acyltransferase [Pseudovirgaria hyperparasitica]KAF2755802.1 acyl-CoA N-acyltransferase [Pseudovirgaria hyperparasitica]
MSLERKYVEVKTPRLLIRPLQPYDAPSIFTMRSDPEVVKYTSHSPDKDVETTMKAMQEWQEAGRYNFVVELLTQDDKESGIKTDHPVAKRKFVGVIGIVRSPEIGYCFSREFWRKGYATEAMQAFLGLAWDHLSQSGGFGYVTAQVDTENIGSNRLLEKVGFKKQKTTVADYESPVLGSVRDSFLWQLDKPLSS